MIFLETRAPLREISVSSRGGLQFRAPRAVAQSQTGLRSLLGQAPDAAEVLQRLGRLLPRDWKDAGVELSARRITADLHPFAPALRLTVAAAMDDAAGGAPRPSVTDRRI